MAWLPMMAKSRDGCLVMIAVLGLASARAAGVHLRGEIAHVGFGGSGQNAGSDYYRVGHWMPILVRLANQDEDLFNGWIEVRQPDRDGDDIVARQEVSVRTNREYYLYVPGGVYKSPRQFLVRVFDEDGQLAPLYDGQDQRIDELAAPREVSPLSNETGVILDISERRVVWQDPSMADALVTAREVGRLPDNVAGLEMVDVIVWDDADPGAVKDATQLRVLTEWTRRGGTLLLGDVRKHWDGLGKRLGEILPDRLPEAPPASEDPRFVARHAFGRGEVLLVPGAIRDVLKDTTRADQGEFFRRLLGVRGPEPTEEAPGSGMGVFHTETDLFGYVEKMTGFQIIAGLYFLFAFAFVIAYIAVATAGSWTWLKRRGMVQHAWLAFAAIALAASGVSLGAVRALRGFGYRVEEFTVVDARVDSPDAVATCYFGLKSPTHTALDLSVPTDWSHPGDDPAAGALRPLPANPTLSSENVYAAAERYEVVPVLGELRSVPLRATLKQFEAVWCGKMTGQLGAELRRGGGRAGPLHPDSWVQNDLGTTLDNCYLLVADQRLASDRTRGAGEITAYPLGELPDGQRVHLETVLARLARERKSAQRPGTGDAEDRDTSDPAPRLSEIHKAWLDKIRPRLTRGFDDEEKVIETDAETFASVLLLLTTFDEVDSKELDKRNQTLVRSQGQRLDRSSELTNDTALFVGFSHDPGPARLCWRKPGAGRDRWKAIRPSRARVMYRIAIPVAD